MYTLGGVAVVSMAVAGPAFGHGTQYDYVFSIDSTQSTIVLAFQGSPRYTWGVGTLSGSYMLNTDCLAGSPHHNWQTPLTAESITATNTTTLQFGFGAQQGTILPGDCDLTDLDRYDNDGPITPTGYPIASGNLTTDLKIHILGTMPVLVTSGNPQGYFLLDEWLEDLTWQVQIADSHLLGATNSLGGESRLNMNTVYPIVAGGTTTYLDVSISLVGGGRPEPATGGLMLAGMAALLCRRRAANVDGR